MRWLLLAGLLLVATAPQAEPLAVHDLNPLTANFALPALPATPQRAVALGLGVGNVSLDQSSSNEHLQLDAERREWALSVTRPFHTTWAWRADLPLVTLSGGALDHLIEGWHRTFGLPNGNRNQWPANRLLIAHTLNGRSDVSVTRAGSGLGDVSLHVAKLLRDQPHQTLSAWLTLKLPTGKAGQLTGSGGTDIALSLSAEQQATASIRTFEQASITHAGSTKYLATQQRQLLLSGAVGASWQWSPRWQWVTQLNAHSAAYDSSVRALGNALQLSIGPIYQRNAWQATLAISEDLAVDTAPDVQLLFNVARRWQ